MELLQSRKTHTSALSRVVALIDMDCFYVQVEQRSQPAFKGKPCAVVQYNAWKGGGIIAVGYEARACGVTRQMRGDQAKGKCPSIHLFRVPEVRGKADLTKYREAGAEVIDVLMRFSDCVERASIDEAYVDLTLEINTRLAALEMDRIRDSDIPNTFVCGWDGEDKNDDSAGKNDARAAGVSSWLSTIFDSDDLNLHEQRLAMGALIMEQMREAVYRDTGFRCSAGIAHNKMLSKLACGIHKPNKQTVLPHSSVGGLFQTMPIRKVRNFGGKFGESLVQQFGVENMGELCQFTEKQLQDFCGEKYGTWVYDVCRGIECEPVCPRQLAKSIGCSKNFLGKLKLDTQDKVKHWLAQLSQEIEERLVKDKEANKRVAKHINFGVRMEGKPESTTASRSCALARYDAQKITDDAFKLLSKFNTLSNHHQAWFPALLNVSMSAGKFVETTGSVSSIKNFLSYDAAASQVSTPSSSMSAQGRGTKRKSEPSPGSIQGFFSQMSQSKRPAKQTQDCALEIYSGEDDVQVLRTVQDESSFADSDDDFENSRTSLKCGQNKSFFANYQKHSIQNQSKEKTLKSDVVSSSSPSKGFFATRGNDLSRKLFSSGHTGQDHNVTQGPSAPISGTGTTYPGQVHDDDSIQNSHTASELKLPFENSSTELSSCTSSSKQPTEASPNVSGCEQFRHTHTDLHVSDADFTHCDRCGERISAWDLPEHLDYHFAQDLQKEHMSTPSPVSRAKTITSSGKRKYTKHTGSTKKGKPASGSPMSTLHNFFKKS